MQTSSDGELAERLHRYKAMPDEYYAEGDDHVGMTAFGDLQQVDQLGYRPGKSVQLWEWMSGSGRLSATARARGMSHLPPLDYRYGHNLGHWRHQLTALFCLFVFPVDVLWSSPTCTPWSVNARQWQAETRDAQRQEEALTLQFLAIACFVQLVLGRDFIIEQPKGSDLFEAYGIKLLTGSESLVKIFTWIFDQCMLGAESGGIPTKKRTQLAASFPFVQDPPQCDGSHPHQILRGHLGGTSRTAAAAVYPHAMCQLILDEVTGVSKQQQLGGEMPRSTSTTCSAWIIW